jgi:hypothetical protein
MKISQLLAAHGGADISQHELVNILGKGERQFHKHILVGENIWITWARDA